MLLSEFVAVNSITSNMVFLQLLNAKQSLPKENKKRNWFLDQLGSNCIYRRWDRITNQIYQKECVVLFNSFCKGFFAFESCKNTMLLEMLLPARYWDKDMPCKRIQKSPQPFGKNYSKIPRPCSKSLCKSCCTVPTCKCSNWFEGLFSIAGWWYMDAKPRDLFSK